MRHLHLSGARAPAQTFVDQRHLVRVGQVGARASKSGLHGEVTRGRSDGKASHAQGGGGDRGCVQRMGVSQLMWQKRSCLAYCKCHSVHKSRMDKHTVTNGETS